MENMMTLPNIESSETPQESESNEVQERVESSEVREEAQQLEQATFEPETVIEIEGSYEQSEQIETAFVEVMQAAETPAAELPISETERPDPSGDGTSEVSDEVSRQAPGTPDPGMETARDEAILQPNEGKHFDTAEPAMETIDPVAIIDSNDSPLAEVGDSPRTIDERVMIDTVPLPEQPAEAGQEVSVPDSIANDGEALQIISNILKNEQDESNSLIENRRGVESENGQEISGAALEEDAVGLSPDDVKVSIGNWPTPERAADGTEIDSDQPLGDLDTPVQDEELMPPQDGMDLEPPANALEDGEADLKKAEGDEGENFLPADWHTYEDEDGNDIIVDGNGKPVDSPPVVYEYQGKKYLAYPGDAPAVDEKGMLKNPKNLIEAPPAYEAPIKDLYIHEDQDGKLTVVDKNGKPVDSPPMIVESEVSGSEHPVKYLAYPGTKAPFDGTGKPTGEKLNVAQEYNAEIKDMYIHEGTDGKLTVVDKNGKPIDSPPMIVESEVSGSEHPVKYLVYPNTKAPFDETGKPTGEKLNVAQEYNAEIKDMYIHEGTDGKLTVVDKNGKPVDSPPKIVEYYSNEGETAVKYLAYPGSKAPFDETGKPMPGVKLNPAQEYSAEIKGMYIHEGPDGKVTVVDKNGKPVESPPIVMEHDPNNDGQTVKYLAYPDTKVFDETGKPLAGAKFNPAEQYQGSTDGLYMHEGEGGKITIVDEKGQPVDSPPDLVKMNGKYYMSYPGTKEAAAIKPDGSIDTKNAKEISYYKPDWWTKNVKQEKIKGA
jgi:hypothetical protein